MDRKRVASELLKLAKELSSDKRTASWAYDLLGKRPIYNTLYLLATEMFGYVEMLEDEAERFKSDGDLRQYQNVMDTAKKQNKAASLLASASAEIKKIFRS